MVDFSQATWDPSIHQTGASMVSFGTDARVHARFFTLPEHQAFDSLQEGRPVYKTVDMIEVRQPGERDAICRQVNSLDLRRFPTQWQAYQEQREQVQVGIPLTVLFPSDPAAVEMMKGAKIHTIEALAGLSEEAIRKLGMHGRPWVKKAQEFIEAATDGATVLRLQGRAEELEARNKDLEQQLASMLARVAKLERKAMKEEAA